MTGDAVDGEARYRAFISYSHKDAAFGRRLHRRLEAYRVPSRLVGRQSSMGMVPRRLAPIFRDREELPAAHDLTTEVRAALQESAALVVVCSPAAAASPWVAREVELFRALHPDRPVLAAVAEGEPAQAFPDCLRRADGADRRIEPLAADFRATSDGPRLGLLKLIAALAGVRLDELVQRDAQRRLQRVTAVTATALVLAVGMGGLALFALDARAEAERQRAEAEGMVEFMLTDLRTRLKGVGRLDVLSAVNERALSYYRKQDLRLLPPDSLERRARLFHAMGEDDQAKGNQDAALTKFREARRTTAALMAADPTSPKRVFTHSQSEFWVGSVAYQRGRIAEAKVAFEAYKTLTDRLISLAPNNPNYRLEAGYAQGNLCSIALQPPPDLDSALKACTVALSQMERGARDLHRPPGVMVDLANRHAWLADVYRAKDDTARARQHRLFEETILTRLLSSDPQNMQLRAKFVTCQRAIAGLDADSGNLKSAKQRLLRARAELARLIAFDSANAEWASQDVRILSDLNHLSQRSASH
jgi:tetratricopeptide (TPR) repeat protein